MHFADTSTVRARNSLPSPRGRPDSSPIYGAASLSILLVVVLTYSLARRITIPLKKLRAGAGVIAAGDFTQRVEVSGRDEIGELARTFNEMAQSLEERSQALLELNRKLEEKVRERTQVWRQFFPIFALTHTSRRNSIICIDSL